MAKSPPAMPIRGGFQVSFGVSRGSPLRSAATDTVDPAGLTKLFRGPGRPAVARCVGSALDRGDDRRLDSLNEFAARGEDV